MRIFRQPASTFSPYDPGAPTVKPDASTPARVTAVRVEDEIRWNDLETGVFIAPAGQVLLRRQGLADRVGFSSRELRRMHGATFTHNHPGESGFSPDDLARAGEAQVAELRVVTPLFRHVIQDFPNLRESKWHALFEIEQQKLAVSLIDQVRTGTLNPKDFGPQTIHLAWVRIAAKMGFSYERSKS